LVDVIVNQLKLLAITKNSLLFSSNLYASSGFIDTLGTLFIRVFMLTWMLSLLRFISIEQTILKKKRWLFFLPMMIYFLI
ncbi:MAG TPA: hypothetical protein PLC92_07355, partial [Chitinophagales bacterium]|nr:hypothetical protein [Chitinophagales bacterium]